MATNELSQAGRISLYSQGVSGVAGLASSLFASRALLSQGRYERGVARENAKTSELYARLVRKGGAAAAKERSLDGKALIARQRVAAAGQGVVVGEGVAADLEADAAADTAEDIQAIHLDAVRQAFGYEMQAVNDRAGGESAMISAKGAAAQNAITGGLQLSRDLMYGASIYERFRPAEMLAKDYRPSMAERARETQQNFIPSRQMPASTFRAGSGRRPR